MSAKAELSCKGLALISQVTGIVNKKGYFGMVMDQVVINVWKSLEVNVPINSLGRGRIAFLVLRRGVRIPLLAPAENQTKNPSGKNSIVRGGKAFCFSLGAGRPWAFCCCDTLMGRFFYYSHVVSSSLHDFGNPCVSPGMYKCCQGWFLTSLHPSLFCRLGDQVRLQGVLQWPPGKMCLTNS